MRRPGGVSAGHAIECRPTSARKAATSLGATLLAPAVDSAHNDECDESDRHHVASSSDGIGPSTMALMLAAANGLPASLTCPIAAISAAILPQAAVLPGSTGVAVGVAQMLGHAHRSRPQLMVAFPPLTLAVLAPFAFTRAAKLCNRHGLVELGNRPEHLSDQFGGRAVIEEGGRTSLTSALAGPPSTIHWLGEAR
jgi:hypothetical protein